MKRILHVIPGMAISSGPTQVVRQLSSAQATSGHQVRVFCLRDRIDADEVPATPGVHLERFSVSGPKSFGYSRALGERLAECMQDHDIIHAHSLWCYQNLAIRSAAKRHGVPYVIRPAGSLDSWALKVSKWRKRCYYALIERGNLREAAALHAMSTREAETLRQRGFGDRVFTVPNGIEIEQVNQRAARGGLRLEEDRPIVLFLGRLHPVKGLELVGKMMQRILAEESDALLLVVGPDRHDYADQIKRLYRELGLGDSVRFWGEADTDTAKLLFQAADVFVLPSESENFGNVVLESIASGTPAVVSRGVPWPDLEANEAGAQIDRDPDLFAEVVLNFLNDREMLKRWSLRAQVYAKKHFSWDKVVTRLDAVYDSIIEERGVAA